MSLLFPESIIELLLDSHTAHEEHLSIAQCAVILHLFSRVIAQTSVTVFCWLVFYHSDSFFNTSISMCVTQDICKALWCHRVGRKCETKFMPAAEGSACGPEMVSHAHKTHSCLQKHLVFNRNHTTLSSNALFLVTEGV